jgi:Ca-activated chloride channel family protein
MSFIWAPLLVLLALIPVGAWVYITLDRRRRRRVAAFGSLGVSQRPAGRRVGLLRRVPAGFFVAGLTILTVGMARPQGQVSLPTLEGTVVLAFDVSGSMAATDLQPTRMEAAKTAARDFVQRQPPGVVIGVVAFSDSGLSVQVPTSDQATVLAAINRLNPQRGTSLGQGILASINVIDAANAPPNQGYYTNQSPAPEPTPTPAPVAPGTHTSAVVILLTDGENNQNPDPLAAAQTAANRGVRIDTVGIGSAEGATLKINGFSVHTQLNEPLLQQISQITDGAYYSATDAQGLQAIYDNLNPQLVIKPQMLELTSLFAGAGIVALLIGGLVSLFALGRLP